jgi:hypothetical protein
MPARPPKPCGGALGQPKGRLSGRAQRSPVLKKTTKNREDGEGGSLAINIKLTAKLLVVKTQAWY